MKKIKEIHVDLKRKNLDFEWQKILENIKKLDNLKI